MVHSERLHDPFLHKLLPAHARHPLNHHSCNYIQKVIIVIFCAEGRCLLKISQVVYDIQPGEGGRTGPHHQVTGTQTHATAMGEEVFYVEI